MINREALGLIKEFEGFRSKAYKDAVGIWTIGYGTTAMAGVGVEPKAGMVITEVQALAYLDAAVAKFEHNVTKVLKRPANENEYGAMVSLAYNIGPAAFAKSSVLRLSEETDIGDENCLLALNLIRSTKFHLSTEPAFLPNCY